MDMSKPEQIKAELQRLLPQMKKVARMIKDVEQDWSGHYNSGDPESMYQRGVYVKAEDKLEDIVWILERAFAEVADEGRLKKGNNGRYSLNGFEFTSGATIEFLFEDGGEKCWVKSRIEHSGRDYYFVNYGQIPLEGLRVRIKRLR
ncbi:hypothetical protein D3C76_179040 [compost metagenome]